MERNELFAALAAAQAEIEGAVKNSTNPHFRSQYADLASVWDAVRKPLTKNGLSVIQLPDIHDGKPVLRTVLAHRSGQSIETVTPIICDKLTPQTYGSALTYARRYALAAIAGVPQVDDDAEAAEGRGVSKINEEQQRQKLLEENRKRILGLSNRLTKLGFDTPQKRQSFFESVVGKKQSLLDYTDNDFVSISNAITEKEEGNE